VDAPATYTSGWIRSPERVAFLLVAGSLALHVLLSGLVSLSPQEAYYWQYARHLDLSYFDHPPLAAWTIRATTALCGDGERAVRLAAAGHAALFALFFFLAGRRLFGARAALLALAAVLVTPIFALGQTVITPDAPLLSGWAAALYFTIRALDDERGAWLLAAGAAVGWASLGKYTGWLLAPQIFLVLLLDARGRRMLAGPWPYVALLLAAAIFSPVVLWNARHGWVSFGFQFGQRGASMRSFSPQRLARFIGLQSLAVTPLLFAALVAAAVAAARRARQAAFRTCALFSIPALGLFLAVSPFMWVKGNWPVPAWPAALLAAAALARERARALRGLTVATLGTAAAGTLYLHLAMAIPALPFPAGDDVTTGWKELAARVAAERARLAAPSFVLGCSYKPASELAYYLPGRPETYAQNAMQEEGLQYDFWLDARALLGREGIVVLDRREWKNCLRRGELCQPLEPLEPLVVRRGSRIVTTFELWRCRFPATMLGNNP
jgi:4-amino-4-deoxy-L-arabinose transferase-like glycosyltransferase